MTLEHKIVVGLDDIKAVTFECNACHVKLTVAPDNIRLPHDCRQCGAAWILEESEYPKGGNPYFAFARAVSTIRDQLKNHAPFKILLEFDEE